MSNPKAIRAGRKLKKPSRKSKVNKRKQEKKTSVTEETKPQYSILDLITEKDSISSKIKSLQEREKQLKERLKTVAEESGVKDSKGSFNLIFDMPDGSQKLISKQMRTKVSLDKIKAKDLFEKLGIWNKVTRTQAVLDDDLIEQQIIANALSIEDLESVTNKKISFACICKKYEPEDNSDEELPTIKTTECKLT